MEFAPGMVNSDDRARTMQQPPCNTTRQWTHNSNDNGQRERERERAEQIGQIEWIEGEGVQWKWIGKQWSIMRNACSVARVLIGEWGRWKRHLTQIHLQLRGTKSRWGATQRWRTRPINITPTQLGIHVVFSSDLLVKPNLSLPLKLQHVRS